MARRIAVVLLVVSLVAGSATSAVAAPQHPVGANLAARDVLVLRISRAHVELDATGNVLVPLRAKCQPPLYTFELGVGVAQDSGSGSVVLLGTRFPPCDGHWHRTTVSVPPFAGSFGPGQATVQAGLQAYDPEGDHDIGVSDTVTVKL
jgi:hypothetical protein